MFPVGLLLLALHPLLACSGCQAPWLASNGSAVVQRLASSVPLQQLALKLEEGTPARERLQEIPALLEFARGRGLRVGDAYQRVDQIFGPASWIVVAAHPSQLDLHLWHFPLVGKVPYKGYRYRDHALLEASRLEQASLIADVLAVPAWSSLGWFPEPLPRSLIELEEERLVDLILHELVHRTLHISGNASLNESLATFLAATLTEEWLLLRHGAASEVLSRHHRRVRDDRKLNGLIDRLRRGLPGGGLEEKIEEFRQLLVNQEWEIVSGSDLAAIDWTLPRILMAQVYDPEQIPWQQIWQESAQNVEILANRVERDFSGTGQNSPSLER